MNSADDFLEAKLAAADARDYLKSRKAKKGFSAQTPHPKQLEFVNLTCREALFGGAASGGKSSALLMCALKVAAGQGGSALILRRTYQELILRGALMDRAHEWLDGSDAKWDAAARRWTFPSGGTIEFGYFDNWADRMRYQSAQYNLICFDELTHFPEEWYSFMFTRTRRGADSKIPSMIRGATNPGSIGHEWVMRRFIAETHPDRVFIPASFRDNPHIDQKDYEGQLALAAPIVRRQMMGEWIHDGNGLVYREFQPANIVDRVPGDLQHFLCGLDFGVVDENAITVLGWRDHDSTIYVVESYRKTSLVDELAAEVKALNAKYQFVKIVGDVGGMGKLFVEEMRMRHGIPIEGAEKANKLGYISLLNADLATRRVLVLRDTCQDLIAEVKELYWDESGTKELGSAKNHACDSFLYCWRACVAFAEEPRQVPKPGTLEDAREATERAYLALPPEDRALWSKRDDEMFGGGQAKAWWEQ